MTTGVLALTVLWLLGSAPATAPVDVTGDWAVTITAADGAISGKSSLKQSGNKVTGTIGPGGDATIPVEGILAESKLTLTTHPQAGRTAAFESCELTVDTSKMTGTIRGGDLGKGRIDFVRTSRSDAASR
jgi:hypothetical protein